jgi:hypothetical protein
VIGTQWEKKARDHEAIHVDQFNGLREPSLTKYFRVDDVLLKVILDDLYDKKTDQPITSRTASADMDDTTIKTRLNEEVKQRIIGILAECARYENGRFKNQWIVKPAQLERIEKPAYEALDEELPVQFTHSSLELWKRYSSFE